MIDIFESFLRSVTANSITSVFSYFLLFVFVFSLISYFLNKLNYFVDYSPTLLTSIGILGTFTGIVVGLLDFDVNNVDSSISSLLSGMKTAFLTSVIGIFLSILLKFIFVIFYRNDSKSKSLEEFIFDQNELIKAQNEYSKILQENITSLLKTIGSDNDSSILGQIKLMRSDINDNNKNLIKTFDALIDNFNNFSNKLWDEMLKFSEMLSKTATQTLIEALSDVISDFNKNLTEQFGDNFKELNSAVEKLVIWQENYKTQMQNMIDLYEMGVQNLSASQNGIEKIAISTVVIPKHMEELSEIMKINQNQIQNLNEHLSAFSELRNNAKEFIPEIQSQISSMLDNVSRANKDFIDAARHNSDSLLQSAGNLEIVANNIENHNQEIVKMQENSLSNFKENLTDIQNQFKIYSENIMISISENIQKVISRMQSESENALQRTGDSINKQLETLDTSLESELARVMQDMGKALTSITGKFTDDYQKLVNAMQDIVNKNRDVF